MALTVRTVPLARTAPTADGIDGIDGVDGDQGEVGPSDAYATFTQSPGTILIANYVTVKSLSLPPGSYTASATAMLFADECRNAPLQTAS